MEDDDSDFDIHNMARHCYYLTTKADGSVVADVFTNDNEDRGYRTEDAEWTVNYPNLDAAQKAIGVSRTGINGCSVEVYLDGKKI